MPQDHFSLRAFECFCRDRQKPYDGLGNGFQVIYRRKDCLVCWRFVGSLLEARNGKSHLPPLCIHSLDSYEDYSRSACFTLTVDRCPQRVFRWFTHHLSCLIGRLHEENEILDFASEASCRDAVDDHRNVLGGLVFIKHSPSSDVWEHGIASLAVKTFPLFWRLDDWDGFHGIASPSITIVAIGWRSSPHIGRSSLIVNGCPCD